MAFPPEESHLIGSDPGLVPCDVDGGDELVAVNAIPPGIGHRGAKRDIAILYGARRFAACRRNDRHQASFRSKNHIPLGMLTVGKRPLLGLHILENA